MHNAAKVSHRYRYHTINMQDYISTINETANIITGRKIKTYHEID